MSSAADLLSLLARPHYNAAVTDAARRIIDAAMELSDEEFSLVLLELQAAMEGDAPPMTPELDDQLQAALDSVNRGEGVSGEDVRAHLAARFSR